MIEGERSSRPLAGGDLGRARWVETVSGPVVEKTYPASVPPALVEAEAAGLRWLTVPGGPPVPRVQSADARTIVLDAVVEGRPTPAGAHKFGAALATLHAARAPAFGWAPSDTVFIGTLPVGVGTFADWPSFWRARTGVLLDALPGVDRRPFDALGARLGTLVPTIWPARVHGDLWSGNVLWDDSGRAWLIDPAAHGGHPELDLALLALFGAPQLERVLAAYAAAAGPALADGWRDRLPLHQVHTLLFHAVAFGGGYLSRTLDVVRRYL
ncbi:fructosamine kinase family protein [Jatrophihabitans sp. YIM 134969]